MCMACEMEAMWFAAMEGARARRGGRGRVRRRRNSLPLKGGGLGRGSRATCAMLVAGQWTPSPTIPLKKGEGARRPSARITMLSRRARFACEETQAE